MRDSMRQLVDLESTAVPNSNLDIRINHQNPLCLVQSKHRVRTKSV